jgi:hypothetical protein
MATDYERYEKALIELREKAYPFAMLKATNLLGQKMWIEWRKEYKRTMTLRNQWTIRSLKLVKSKRPVIQSMRVIVGTRLEYLKTNEEGGIAKPDGQRKHGMMNPTNKARRGGSYRGLVPRSTSAGARGLKGKQIGTVAGGSRNKRNAAQIRQAQKDRKKLAMIEGENGKIGFYKMRKGKKNRDGSFQKKGVLMWSLKPSQKIPKNNAMERAKDKTQRFFPTYYTAALKREIAEVKRRKNL